VYVVGDIWGMMSWGGDDLKVEDLDGGGVMSALKIGYDGDWATSFIRQLN